MGSMDSMECVNTFERALGECKHCATVRLNILHVCHSGVMLLIKRLVREAMLGTL